MEILYEQFESYSSGCVLSIQSFCSTNHCRRSSFSLRSPEGLCRIDWDQADRRSSSCQNPIKVQEYLKVLKYEVHPGHGPGVNHCHDFLLFCDLAKMPKPVGLRINFKSAAFFQPIAAHNAD
jgi:hypothetical protein